MLVAKAYLTGNKDCVTDRSELTLVKMPHGPHFHLHDLCRKSAIAIGVCRDHECRGMCIYNIHSEMHLFSEPFCRYTSGDTFSAVKLVDY